MFCQGLLHQVTIHHCHLHILTPFYPILPLLDLLVVYNLTDGVYLSGIVKFTFP